MWIRCWKEFGASQWEYLLVGKTKIYVQNKFSTTIPPQNYLRKLFSRTVGVFIAKTNTSSGSINLVIWQCLLSPNHREKTRARNICIFSNFEKMLCLEYLSLLLVEFHLNIRQMLFEIPNMKISANIWVRMVYGMCIRIVIIFWQFQYHPQTEQNSLNTLQTRHSNVLWSRRSSYEYPNKLKFNFLTLRKKKTW